MASSEKKRKGEDEKQVVVPKSSADVQRLKLEKLMKNPDKPVFIPERPKNWNPKAPPEFVRNVWGSSSGAGSGEFHVYRGIRRREYARQNFLQEKQAHDDKEAEYQNRIEENKKQAEDRTAKKRAKRLKQKMKNKAKKKKPNKEETEDKESESEKSEDDEEEEKEDDAEETSFIPGGR